MTEKIEPRAGCPLQMIKDRIKYSEAGGHLRNARREMLLAVRSVIDSCLARIDACDERASQGEAHKVEIN